MSSDRQTDKATWWSITAFDEEEKRQLSSGKWPPMVKKVYGGLEECPDTKRVHYQGAVQCRGQQRFSAIKKWLPKAYIEAARDIAALKQYAMKDETAIGEKEVLENQTPFVDNQAALYMIAREKIEYGIEQLAQEFIDKKVPLDKIADFEYVLLANRIVYREPHLCGVLTKPDVQRGWKMFRETFVKLVDEGRADSITARPANEIVEPAEGT